MWLAEREELKSEGVHRLLFVGPPLGHDDRLVRKFVQLVFFALKTRPFRAHFPWSMSRQSQNHDISTIFNFFKRPFPPIFYMTRVARIKQQKV